MTSNTLYSGEWLELKKLGRYEFVTRRKCSGVAIITAITEARQIVLVEQFRAAVERPVLELPAGLVGDIKGNEEEPHIEAAKRELLEETGYLAGRIQHIFTGPISAGMTNELPSFFLADQLIKKHAGGGDDTENITVHVVELSDIEAYLKEKSEKGLLIDPKIYIGLYQIAQYL